MSSSRSTLEQNEGRGAGVFGANGGSIVGLAMAGHPWILPLLACIKATSLVQLN